MAETTPINNQLEIDAVWDDAAEVWVAESDGVPGLVTEADSRVRLIDKLAVLIPELLELNNQACDAQQPIEVVIRFRRDADNREERIRIPKAA